MVKVSICVNKNKRIFILRVTHMNQSFTNSTKPNENKCCTLHLGWSNCSPPERHLGVLVSRRCNRSQQSVCPGSQESKPHLECIKHSIIRQSKEVIIPPYLSLVQPHLEYCVRFRASPFEKYVKVHEHNQRRVPLLPDKVLAGISSEKQLRSLGFSNFERWRLRGDLSALYSFLRRL